MLKKDLGFGFIEDWCSEMISSSNKRNEVKDSFETGKIMSKEYFSELSEDKLREKYFEDFEIINM